LVKKSINTPRSYPEDLLWEKITIGQDNVPVFPFTPRGSPGLDQMLPEERSELDFFSLLLDDSIMESLVVGINQYAQTQLELDLPATKNRADFSSWKDVDTAEFRKFLGEI
jgi:Transposase IS4